MILPPVLLLLCAVVASELAKQLMQQSRSSFCQILNVFDGERGLNLPYGACPVMFSASRDPSHSGSANFSCRVGECTGARSVCSDQASL